MENKVLKFGYEDTDKKIEVELYGLSFEADIKSQDIEELKNIKDDVKLEELEKIIDKHLGKNAVEKINEKRKQDGYNEIDEDVAMKIIMFIIKVYANTMLEGLTDITDEIDNRIDNTMNKINEVKNYRNREEKRNYNTNQYRGRRNYRRY